MKDFFYEQLFEIFSRSGSNLQSLYFQTSTIYHGKSFITINFFDNQRLEVRDYITIVDIRCKKFQKLPQKIIFKVSQYWLFRRGAISQKRSRYVIFLFLYFHTLDITRKCAKFEKNLYWESMSNWTLNLTTQNGVFGSLTLGLE